MSYFPVPEDRSGQIMAQGMMGAADATANMYNQLGGNIGNALANIGGVIGGAIEKKSMGDSAYEALGAIGEMYPGMKNAFTALGKMDPRTRRLASMSILDNLGAISQLGIAGMNNQTRRDAPYVEAGLKNQQNIAGGNVPHGSMGVPRPPSGMGNVEPDLPVADEDLPAVTPPLGAVPQSIPGGDESMRRYNEWKRQRGY
jgi:hypothetical protein